MNFKARQKQVLDLITERSQELPGNLIYPKGFKNIHRSFEVYSLAYRAHIFDGLGGNFESIWKILGDDHFMELCDIYRKRNLSQNYNLNDIGEGFPLFLQSSKWMKEIPFISELAELDWLVSRMFHKKQLVHRESQISASAKDLELKVKEGSHYWLKTTFDIFSVWSALLEERELEEVEKKDQGILIYKIEDMVRVSSFESSDLLLVDGLLNSLGLTDSVSVGMEMGYEFSNLGESLEILKSVPGFELVEV